MVIFSGPGVFDKEYTSTPMAEPAKSGRPNSTLIGIMICLDWDNDMLGLGLRKDAIGITICWDWDYDMLGLGLG
jgi:hypothetical protein